MSCNTASGHLKRNMPVIGMDMLARGGVVVLALVVSFPRLR